jgi:hypothetical protein
MTAVPVSYRFEGRIFRLTNVGESTVDELIATFEAALDDPDFPDRAILLWDIRESTSLEERSTDELRRITSALGPKAHRHSNTSALLVSSDLYYGLMRMATAYGDEFESNSKLFRDEAEALEWIDSIGNEDID